MQSKDYFCVVWSVEDVQFIVEHRLNKKISRHSSRKILKYLEKNYDADIGITWNGIVDAVEALQHIYKIQLTSLT